MPMKPITMRIPQRKAGITLCSYKQVEWPQLASSLLSLLTNPTMPLSMDSHVNLVYRICTAGLMSHCYKDLRDFIAGYLDKLANALVSTPVNNFLYTLAEAMANYRLASQKILVMFQYLERQYISKQLQVNFTQELETELGNRIARNTLIHQRLREFLPKTKPSTSFSTPNGKQDIYLDPSVLQPLISCLYQFEPKYNTYNPELFSLYIPRLYPDKGLESERLYTQQYLENNTPTLSGQPHKKRKYYEVYR